MTLVETRMARHFVARPGDIFVVSVEETLECRLHCTVACLLCFCTLQYVEQNTACIGNARFSLVDITHTCRVIEMFCFVFCCCIILEVTWTSMITFIQIISIIYYISLLLIKKMFNGLSYAMKTKQEEPQIAWHSIIVTVFNVINLHQIC